MCGWSSLAHIPIERDMYCERPSYQSALVGIANANIRIQQLPPLQAYRSPWHSGISSVSPDGELTIAQHPSQTWSSKQRPASSPGHHATIPFQQPRRAVSWYHEGLESRSQHETSRLGDLVLTATASADNADPCACSPAIASDFLGMSTPPPYEFTYRSRSEGLHLSLRQSTPRSTFRRRSSPLLDTMRPLADNSYPGFDFKRTHAIGPLQTESSTTTSRDGNLNVLQMQQEHDPDHAMQFGSVESFLWESPPDFPTADQSTEVMNTAEAATEAKSFAKHLLSLRKEIDILLLKRIQYRSQSDTLKHCHQYLRESISELMSVIQLPHPMDFAQSAPRKKKKKRRRSKGKKRKEDEEMLFPGEEAGSGVLSSSAQADLNTWTVEAFPDYFEALDSSTITTTNSPPRIDTLHKQYVRDYEALMKQEEIEKEMMEDLSRREYHLSNLLKDIQTDLRSSKFGDELRTEMMQGSMLEADASLRTSSNEELPPLIEEYFDIQGNIGIFLERLQELDFQHQEGLMEREFVRDRGDELDPSDEEFYINYNDQRAQIEQNLSDARRQIAIVKADCERHGLDIEEYRNAPPSQRSMTQRASSQLGHANLPNVRQANDLSAHGRSASRAHGPPVHMIEGWLRDLPDVPLADENIVPDISLANDDVVPQPEMDQSDNA